MIQRIKEWYSLTMLAYVLGRYPDIRIAIEDGATKQRIVRALLLVGNDMLGRQQVVVLDGDRELRRGEAVSYLNAWLLGVYNR